MARYGAENACGSTSRMRTFRRFTRRGAAGSDLAAKQPGVGSLARSACACAGLAGLPGDSGAATANWSVSRAIERGVNALLASFLRRGYSTRWLPRFAAPAHRLAMRVRRSPARWRRYPQCANVEHLVTMPLNGAQLDVAVFWRQWLNWQASRPRNAPGLFMMRWRGLHTLMRQQATARGITTLVFSGG